MGYTCDHHDTLNDRNTLKVMSILREIQLEARPAFSKAFCATCMVCAKIILIRMVVV
jgi:hypothetical protein